LPLVLITHLVTHILC